MKLKLPCLSLLALVFGFTSVVVAFPGQVWADGGMLDEMPTESAASSTVTITVSPSFLASGVAHVANGVSMRNSCTGTIALRGIPSGSTLRSAFLYWNYMNNSAVGATSDIETFNGKTVTGTKVADQPDLCWLTGGDHSYRAAISPLATGNYTFSVNNCKDNSKQNPWNPLLSGLGWEYRRTLATTVGYPYPGG
jgi:hypothetical protein